MSCFISYHTCEMSLQANEVLFDAVRHDIKPNYLTKKDSFILRHVKL